MLPTGLTLRPRERAGLVIAIVALAVTLNPLKLRIWLRDDVVKGVPFWLDHLLFMLTLMLLVWGLIGLLVLGPRGSAIPWPIRSWTRCSEHDGTLNAVRLTRSHLLHTMQALQHVS
jgi:hypothetical protein